MVDVIRKVTLDLNKALEDLILKTKLQNNIERDNITLHKPIRKEIMKQVAFKIYEIVPPKILFCRGGLKFIIKNEADKKQ